jgi:hypothetical protein
MSAELRNELKELHASMRDVLRRLPINIIHYDKIIEDVDTIPPLKLKQRIRRLVKLQEIYDTELMPVWNLENVSPEMWQMYFELSVDLPEVRKMKPVISMINRRLPHIANPKKKPRKNESSKQDANCPDSK